MELYKNCIIITVIYIVVTLSNVCGEIGVNCGPGTVVGQPYKLQCTNIPATTSGINVFLEGVSNSIIFCFTSKYCIPRDPSLYSVVSPHNKSLYFTIKNVTTDDVGKKVYCDDSTTLDHSQPSCTIANPILPKSTTSISDNQPYQVIGVNCGPGAVDGQPYKLQCTNIPDTTSGINVFLEGVSNSIIFCLSSKQCASRNSSLYSVVSPHNESLYFTILNVTTDDIGKKVYCVDGANLDLSSARCQIDGDENGLSGGESAAIVIGCLVFVAVIVVIFIMWNKKCFCFSKI